MEYYNNATCEMERGAVSLLEDVGARSRFLTRTYLNLTGAVVAFAAIETLLFAFFGAEIATFWLANAKVTGIALLILCLGGPFVANAILNASKTKFGHYVALAFYVALYVLIFMPILTIALRFTDGGLPLVGQAAGLTISLFVALTAAVFVTRKDFSFLRSFLVFATLAALGLIVASMLFGFALGVVFSGAMIALACCYILYDTSKVMLHCDETMDVVASIELFASLMTLFYYVLHLLLSLNRD
ncbi:MAG: Bax inhibitor-1 family protein [Thermoguttaceae bacterium]|nr:Bax inhibitor-1 family protein [Thermoguttaceae bacterium]